MKTTLGIIFATACLSLMFACSKDEDLAVTATGTATKQLKTKGAPDFSDPGTQTYVYQFFVDWPSTLPVVCGGETIDHLVAQNFYVMSVDHFKDGNWEREVAGSPHLTYYSQKNGEPFVCTAFKQKWSADVAVFYVLCNFLGSSGTRYIAHLTFDGYTGEVIEAKSVCR